MFLSIFNLKPTLDFILIFLEEKNKKSAEMFEQKVYHGSDTVNEDGTRFLIDFENGERYVLPTSEPFRKNPAHVTNRVEPTMSTNKKFLY